MALYFKWPRFDEERIERGMPEQGTGYDPHFMKFTCMYNMYMSGEFRLLSLGSNPPPHPPQ